MMDIKAHSRRRFLAFAAASPLLAQQAPPLLTAPRGTPFAIKTPKDALAIRDLEEACGKTLEIAHFAYIQTGIDDDYTLKANMAAYLKIAIKPRRLLG